MVNGYIFKKDYWVGEGVYKSPLKFKGDSASPALVLLAFLRCRSSLVVANVDHSAK